MTVHVTPRQCAEIVIHLDAYIYFLTRNTIVVEGGTLVDPTFILSPGRPGNLILQNGGEIIFTSKKGWQVSPSALGGRPSIRTRPVRAKAFEKEALLPLQGERAFIVSSRARFYRLKSSRLLLSQPWAIPLAMSIIAS